MTTFVAWAVRTYSDREKTYYRAVSIFNLTADQETDQVLLKFGSDAEFWVLLAGFSLIYAGCFALANLSNLRKSRLTWTLAAGAFIIPLIPLLFTLGVMAGIYICVIKTMCVTLTTLPQCQADLLLTFHCIVGGMESGDYNIHHSDIEKFQGK